MPNSKIGQIVRYGDAGPGPKGQVMTVAFELDGLTFTALNGGPQYRPTEALSLWVDCADQAEVDPACGFCSPRTAASLAPAGG